MNSIKQCLLGMAMLAMSPALHAADLDAEASFGALRMKVAELKPHEPAEVLERIENARKFITACPDEEATNSRIHIGLNEVDYTYTSISTSNDDQYYCLLLEKPLNRALTVDEARDFSAAMMMPDIQHFVGGRRTKAEQAAIEARGEIRFARIRELVASGKAKLLDPDATDRAIRPPANLDNLQDCSRTSIDELERRSWDGSNSMANDNHTLYNDTYYWRDLNPTGAHCIYMTAPFHRGLTVQEARDFLMALQLDLGYSDEFQREMFGDGSANSTDNSTPAGYNVNQKKN